mgnify:CR=1 FL=1
MYISEFLHVQVNERDLIIGHIISEGHVIFKVMPTNF